MAKEANGAGRTNGVSPTVRGRRLGIELRRLREQAGLTCEEVGERLECSGTRISRIETGRIRVRPGDVRELLDVYGVTGEDERESLVRFAREARRKGWWRPYADALPDWFEPYVGLESAAATLRIFQPLMVDGLLQTEDYARAVLRAAPEPGTPGDIERRVALRMRRQAVLTKDEPPHLWMVLSETALRARIGTPEVMRDQLRHLAEVAGWPNVTLQVLPLTAGAHADPISPFTILEFPELLDPDAVYLEHLTGSLFLEKLEEIRRYRLVYEHLRAEALGASESAELITGVTGEL